MKPIVGYEWFGIRQCIWLDVTFDEIVVNINMSMMEIVLYNVIILNILKHFREFVQTDWFLPVFISLDRDMVHGALGIFHVHAPGPGLNH